VNIYRGIKNIILNGVTSGISFILLSAMALLLTKENFNKYSVIQSTAAIFTSIALLGLSEVVIKSGVRRYRELSPNFIVIWTIQLVFSINIFILLNQIIFKLELIMTVIYIIAVSLLQYTCIYFKIYRRYEVAQLVSSAAWPCALIMTAILFKGSESNQLEKIIYSSGLLVILVIIYFQFRKKISIKELFLKLRRIKILNPLLLDSLKIGALNFLYILFISMDMLAVNYFHKNSVGDYRITAVAMQLILIPNIVFNMYTSNFISNNMLGNHVLIKKIINKNRLIQTIIALFISIIIYLYSVDGVNFFFDGKYNIKQDNIVNFIITALFFSLIGSLPNYLIYTNNVLILIKIYISAIAINFILLYIFVGDGKDTDASRSLVTSTLILLIFVHVAFYKKIKINIKHG
jgi:O-antigen/teichoic acid export membrane protein